MEVTNIFEAYTIAYGWTVYKMFFLIFLSIGAILYPMARMVSDLIGNYFERGGDPIGLAKAGMYRMAVIFLVILLGLLPVVPLDMSVAQVRSPCGLSDMTQNEDAGTYNFEFEQSRVPVVPWVVMQLASGTRSVINTLLPCVGDLTAVTQLLRTLDISQADDPVKLNNEQQRFSSECFLPSVAHYQRTMRGDYGQDASDQMRQMTSDYVEENRTTKHLILSIPSSSFLRDNFYQKPDFCNGLAEGAVMYDFCLGLPIKALGPVDQITSSDVSLLSNYQKAIGETIPTCDEWFSTPKMGLRDQLYTAAEKGLASVGTYTASNMKYADSGGPWWDFSGPFSDLAQSTHDFVGGIIGGGKDAYEDFIVDKLYVNTSQAGGGALLNAQNRDLANTLATVGTAGAFLGLFGFDVGEAIATTAVSFYTSALMYRIVASLFLPMLIMGVFMFWAYYIIISECKGIAMLQGAIFIYVLSIIPAIWSIGNHLDDQLYVALFPQTSSLADILKSPADHIERIILDVVSTVYYIILPIILLYVTMMAGASKQTMGTYREGGNNSATRGGSSVGGSAGGAFSKNVSNRISSNKSNNAK